MTNATSTTTATPVIPILAADRRHAIAVATAQADVEIAKEHYAAVVIQTAFRGYLVSASNTTNVIIIICGVSGFPLFEALKLKRFIC